MLEIATQDPSVLQKFSHFASEVRIDSRRSCFITEFTFHLEEICAWAYDGSRLEYLGIGRVDGIKYEMVVYTLRPTA
jgi:hypothetical protein